MNNLFKTTLGAIVGLFTFSACVNIPEGAVAVKPFDSGKYLGKWYEIARMDFRFERGLNNTTAHYSLNKDGSIRVENRGYDYQKKQWKQAVGKARLAGAPDEARLKVSFFGPFYAGYNVLALDEQYKYALVAGGSLDYLWILSRETTIPETTKQAYLQLALRLGFDTKALIWVEHDEK
jgi:apolipoprotein D and lipocalin family protein